MFDAYARTQSCFQNSDMMAKGKPSPEELALLEPFKGKLPPTRCSAKLWIRPVSDGSGQDRRLLRRSAELLNAAGWTVKDGKRVNAKGEPLTVEFLVFERVSEPHHALYIKNLGALGIEATMRVVDPVQYRSRMQEFDFDITMNRMVLPLTPGDALRALLLQQVGRRQRLAQLRRHRQSGGRCADRARRSRPTTARASTPPAGRSTACCAPSTTGSPAGTSRRTGSPIGTCSAGPRQSRATRAAYRRPGGSTPRRRRKLG